MGHSFGSDITFQLTTSRRGRRFLLCKNIFENNFNSRPHEEVDRRRMDFCGMTLISTHDLTKRSTDNVRVELTQGAFQLTTSRRGRPIPTSACYLSVDISTHDLTKRSTVLLRVLQTMITSFQLTTSRRGRRLVQAAIDFTMSFQLTTSRRGRRRVGGG